MITVGWSVNEAVAAGVMPWMARTLGDPGRGTALVGDPQTVAARIREYADLGLDTFGLVLAHALGDGADFPVVLGEQHDDAENDAIPGEGREIVTGNETQQPAHAQES